VAATTTRVAATTTRVAATTTRVAATSTRERRDCGYEVRAAWLSRPG
jgi:hypothetical protein